MSGYFSKEVNPTGRRSIIFDKRKSHSGVRIPIPCGECIGCRLVEARAWAIRCLHEKRSSSASAFVTLTYDDAHLPRDNSLSKEALQLFMKRLRKARGDGIRFFACGEYGSRTLRPHYHLLLFNVDFPDRRPRGASPSGEQIYSSESLGRVWSFGNNIIGDVTFRSASYVAKYCLKKVGAPPPLPGLEPEFRTMSLRPGIGRPWFDQFHEECYRHDSAIMDAREVPLPRFYDNNFKLVDEKRLERIKFLRRVRAMKARADNTHARRCVKERVEVLKSKLFNRSVE